MDLPATTAIDQARFLAGLGARPFAATPAAPAAGVIDNPEADPITAVTSGEGGKTSGKDSPTGGNPLPSVLLQTPARDAPGLVDRIDRMTRAIGHQREALSTRLNRDNSSSEIFSLNSTRNMAAQVISRIVAPAQPASTPGDDSLAVQSAGQESQSALLGASSLHGVEKSPMGRIATLSGLTGNAGFSLHVTPDSPAWSSQLGNHIRWMNNVNLSSAELKLYPAELGTLEIHIAADDDQTRVSFITSNAAARDLIESSLPRLRELLGQSGLLLEQGDVTHRDSSPDSSGSRMAHGNGTMADPIEAEIDGPIPSIYRRTNGDHQIDQFA